MTTVDVAFSCPVHDYVVDTPSLFYVSNIALVLFIAFNALADIIVIKHSGA